MLVIPACFSWLFLGIFAPLPFFGLGLPSPPLLRLLLIPGNSKRSALTGTNMHIPLVSPLFLKPSHSLVALQDTYKSLWFPLSEHPWIPLFFSGRLPDISRSIASPQPFSAFLAVPCYFFPFIILLLYFSDPHFCLLSFLQMTNSVLVHTFSPTRARSARSNSSHIPYPPLYPASFVFLFYHFRWLLCFFFILV